MYFYPSVCFLCLTRFFTVIVVSSPQLQISVLNFFFFGGWGWGEGLLFCCSVAFFLCLVFSKAGLAFCFGIGVSIRCGC